ncbi:hypothetical protein [Brevundimonas sp.]|uniref:hypothetical protein n=1 Tax=Brevundimonas sp. TaxID=1871086 RepID=UPI003918D108|nr:hypothetical protein [Brevundimonas sp.]MCA3716661.1 hypothetical protein [Brevundimonas sp.]
MIGAILLVGGIGLLDLRLLGYGKGISPAALSRAVTPLALAGFAMMAVSGLLMFAADAEALSGSALFWGKMVLIGVAGLNAWTFRSLFSDLADEIPDAAKGLAAGSLVMWIGVVVMGRLIAYF